MEGGRLPSLPSSFASFPCLPSFPLPSTPLPSSVCFLSAVVCFIRDFTGRSYYYSGGKTARRAGIVQVASPSRCAAPPWAPGPEGRAKVQLEG